MMTFSGKKFTTRFLSLVIAGYLIGLISIAWAVWLVSQPILNDMSEQSLRDILRVEATAFSAELDRHLDAVEYMADDSAVIELAIGYDEFRSTTEDRIEALFEDPGFRAAGIYDFSGTGVVQWEQDGAWISRPGIAEALRTLVDETLRAQNPQSRPELRILGPSDMSNTHFVLVRPIVSRGLVEGVLIAELQLDLSDFLPHGSFIQGPLLAGSASAQLDAAAITDPSRIQEPIVGTELRLVSSLDAATTGQAGVRLVTSVLKALVVVLAVPFLAIIAVGYRVLVEPQKRLAESEQAMTRQSNELSQLASIVQAMHDAVVTTDPEQRIQWANPAFERLTGFELSEVMGYRLGDFLEEPGENLAGNSEMDLAYAACSKVRTELRYRRSDKTPFWVSANITPVWSDGGEIMHFALILSDITTNKAYEEELARTQEETRQRSLHDSLTALPNRRYFDEILAPMIDGPDEGRCLVRIDLDHFKAVNDSFGHAAGDHVLCVVADLMRQWCDADDFPARVGGDEFLILMEQGKTEEDADRLCTNLRRDISRDIPFEGSICRVGASFGIASSVMSFVDIKDLLVAADNALYKSKELGRNRTTLYTAELHSSVQESRRLSIELEAAIEKQEFEPWFQPQFDATTGALVGVEALARWNHPERGILEPWRFMPAIDRLGLTTEMDGIIYHKGLRFIEDFRADGVRIPRISFNVSNQQIENPLLGAIADGFDLGETKVSLEILESVVIEDMSDEKLSNLFALRERGFGLELDDFGSGHASIAGLLKLRPDVIKIDKMLVRPVATSPVAQELIASIVDIGRALGVEVTAEGAETYSHVEILRGCGCQYIQGFYFSRPLSAEDLTRKIINDAFPKILNDGWDEPIIEDDRKRPA